MFCYASLKMVTNICSKILKIPKRYANIISNKRSVLEGCVMDYKKLVIEMVNNSNDMKMLELVYRFCKKILC